MEGIPARPSTPDGERGAAERYPRRYVNLEDVRRHHAERVHEIGRCLRIGDPPADDAVAAFAAMRGGKGRRMLDAALAAGAGSVDDAPAPLREFFRALDEPPAWLDRNELARGGRAILRAGPVAALVLTCKSLPLAYLSPAGAKPLAFTGQMIQRAGRRLAETARFVLAVAAPGGLRRDGAGFHLTVRVRLMHAQVRRLLLQSGRWDAEAWGAPVNQSDMAGTNLLLSIVMMDELRRLGFWFSGRERRGILALWRYAGWLMGIEPGLLCATPAEARRLWDLIHRTQAAADDDSRALAHALMRDAGRTILYAERASAGPVAPPWITSLFYALSGMMVGRPAARSLRYPAIWYAPLLRPLLFGAVAPCELLRAVVPGGGRIAARWGERFLRRVFEKGLAGRPALRPIPGSLARSSLPAS